MINQQLLDYIKQQLQQGIAQEQIKNNLLANGWLETDVSEAFVRMNSSNIPSPLENAPVKPLSTFSPEPERGSNKALLFVTLVLIVLLIGGGVFGYFYYSKETPEKIIENMIASFAEVKTMEYQGEIKAEVTMPSLLGGGFVQSEESTPDKQTSYLSLNFNGKSDINDLNNPKGSFAFNIKTDLLKELTQAESFFDLEIRALNKAIYYKLDDIPDLGFFDLSFLNNQWIRISLETLEESLGSSVGILESADFKKEIRRELEAQWGANEEQLDELNRIAKAFLEDRTEKMSNEKIEGVDARRYKLVIDKEALKKLILDITKVIEPERVVGKDINELSAELDRDLEALEFIGGEVWIGEKDFLPYKVSFTINTKETDMYETASIINMTVLFKNYNKPVQIDVPSPVRDMEEVLEELFGGFYMM